MTDRRKGFTLLETLAALMVAVMFTLGLTLGSVRNAQAEEKSEKLLQALHLARETLRDVCIRANGAAQVPAPLRRRADRLGMHLDVTRRPDSRFPEFERVVVTVQGRGLPHEMKLVRYTRRLP